MEGARNIEVIVVDGGSTDKTVTVAQNLSLVTRVLHSARGTVLQQVGRNNSTLGQPMRREAFCYFFTQIQSSQKHLIPLSGRFYDSITISLALFRTRANETVILFKIDLRRMETNSLLKKLLAHSNSN
jgi:predicted amino acid racemase